MDMTLKFGASLYRLIELLRPKMRANRRKIGVKVVCSHEMSSQPIYACFSKKGEGGLDLMQKDLPKIRY
jgi:hypothetical protein